MNNGDRNKAEAVNPYNKCPVYETDNFVLRLVREEDAADLLYCYSDSESRTLFNSDSCTSDFCYNTAEEMKNCITIWLDCYKRQDFVRFSIVEKQENKAVGTIEIFGFVGNYKTKRGILRLDIASAYERTSSLAELFGKCLEEFYDLFRINEIVTKAVPHAFVRKSVLEQLGFIPYEFPGREHYLVHPLPSKTPSDFV